MSPEDKLEDRISFLRLQVKHLEQEMKEMRKTMNGLAHAVALLTKEKKMKTALLRLKFSILKVV